MSEKKWDSSLYQDRHSYVWKYGEALIESLDLQSGDHILDVGCGTGQLTASLAEKAKKVVGIDSSEDMIESAKANFPKSKHPNLSFEVQKAESFKFNARFNKIFSNAALHWVLDADSAIQSMRSVLDEGGLLVLEMGGSRNVETIINSVKKTKTAMGFPLSNEQKFFFPTIGDYSNRLEKTGFEVNEAFLFDRMTDLDDGESGLRNWVTQFQMEEMKTVPEDKLESFFEAIEMECRERLWFDDRWHADYRRLRIKARAI